MPDSLLPDGPLPSRLLCPWGFLNKNTEVGCHALLQGIVLTQGSKLHLLHCRQILYCWATGDALTYVETVTEKENIHLSLRFHQNRSIIKMYVLTYILTANVWQLASSKFGIQHWPSLPILSHQNSAVWEWSMWLKDLTDHIHGKKWEATCFQRHYD